MSHADSAPSITRRLTRTRPKPQPGERRPVLLSLHARWTQAILSGEKTVELRRSACGCEPGTPVVLYSSHPVKRLQGVATVNAVHALAPDELWRHCGAASGVSRAHFDTYLEGLDVAYGIELRAVRAVPGTPLGFHGPQSWRYLYADEALHVPLLAALDAATPRTASGHALPAPER